MEEINPIKKRFREPGIPITSFVIKLPTNKKKIKTVESDQVRITPEIQKPVENPTPKKVNYEWIPSEQNYMQRMFDLIEGKIDLKTEFAYNEFFIHFGPNYKNRQKYCELNLFDPRSLEMLHFKVNYTENLGSVGYERFVIRVQKKGVDYFVIDKFVQTQLTKPILKTTHNNEKCKSAFTPTDEKVQFTPSTHVSGPVTWPKPINLIEIMRLWKTHKSDVDGLMDEISKNEFSKAVVMTYLISCKQLRQQACNQLKNSPEFRSEVKQQLIEEMKTRL